MPLPLQIVVRLERLRRAAEQVPPPQEIILMPPTGPATNEAKESLRSDPAFLRKCRAKTPSALSNAPGPTSTQMSRSPLVMLPGTEVEPTCSIRACWE